MKARILDKSEERKWDEFVENHSLASIHQFSKWGHFQAKIPARGKYWIIVLEENTKIIGGSMIIRHTLPKGYCWFYSARGPLLDYESSNIKAQLQEIYKALSPLASQENAIFYRIDPPLSTNPWGRLTNSYKNHLGFQPEHTLILDLNLSEKDILAQMKQKGRYNIRLAEKKDLKIIESDPKNSQQFEQDIETFYSILHETTARDKFHGHEKSFYENLIKILYPNAKLYLAQHKGQTIAGIIVTFFQKTAIYYYGASSNNHRNLMAPYLLQWHAILEGKSKGYKNYDFLGIAPEKAKNHPWKGVTDFKKKFGGTLHSYISPRDLPFQKTSYFLYRIYKWIKGQSTSILITKML